jgi:hypothetical protein
MFAAFFNQTFKSQTEEVEGVFQKHSSLLTGIPVKFFQVPLIILL